MKNTKKARADFLGKEGGGYLKTGLLPRFSPRSGKIPLKTIEVFKGKMPKMGENPRGKKSSKDFRAFLAKSRFLRVPSAC